MTPLVFWEWSHRLLVLIVFATVVALIIRAVWLPGRLWLYCSMSLLLLAVPAVIGGLSILYPLHWVFAAIDQAFAMLFLREHGRAGSMVAPGRRRRGRTASRTPGYPAVVLISRLLPSATSTAYKSAY